MESRGGDRDRVWRGADSGQGRPGEWEDGNVYWKYHDTTWGRRDGSRDRGSVAHRPPRDFALGREPNRRASSRDWRGGEVDGFSDRRSRENVRYNVYGGVREEYGMGRRRSEPNAWENRHAERRRGCDDTVGRILQAPSNAGTRRASLSSDSDSSETDYTRKPRRMEVRLAPHEQLELLDAWLREHPEVATEVKALDDIAKGVVTDKRPSNFQDGDWLCGTCNEHNFRNRLECRGCGAPSPTEKRYEGRRDTQT